MTARGVSKRFLFGMIFFISLALMFPVHAGAGGGLLTGEVRKSPTNEVIAGASVTTHTPSCQSPCYIRSTSTLSNGVYIITNHPLGQYTVKITYGGYQDHNDSFDLQYDNQTIIRSATMIPLCTDNDSDGYGNPGNASCPNGPATDCNDGNPAISPGAAEICDGTDNDCDAYIDEGFTDTDSDGVADCVDSDDDNDGIPDASDTCPLTKPAKVAGVYYNTLQAAYNGAAEGAAVQSQTTTFTGDLDINIDNKTVTIEGGYDCSYSTVTGMTTINGKMTISYGKVIIGTGNLKVQ